MRGRWQLIREPCGVGFERALPFHCPETRGGLLRTPTRLCSKRQQGITRTYCTNALRLLSLFDYSRTCQVIPAVPPRISTDVLMFNIPRESSDRGWPQGLMPDFRRMAAWNHDKPRRDAPGLRRIPRKGRSTANAFGGAAAPLIIQTRLDFAGLRETPQRVSTPLPTPNRNEVEFRRIGRTWAKRVLR